jgi:hypothetical protein
MIKLLLSYKTFELGIGSKVVFHRDIIVYNNLYRDKFINLIFLIYLSSLDRQ